MDGGSDSGNTAAIRDGVKLVGTFSPDTIAVDDLGIISRFQIGADFTFHADELPVLFKILNALSEIPITHDVDSV